MHICIISKDYPDHKRTAFFFVKNLVDAWIKIPNIKISVIAPYSITKNMALHKFHEAQSIGEGKVVNIYRPNYFSLSNLKIFNISFTSLLFNDAVNRGLEKIPQKIDAIYGHFWESAYSAYKFAKKHNIPLFVATGESTIPIDNITGDLSDFCNYVKGVVCVSSKNKQESINLNLTDKSKCIVVPNAIDNTIFKVLDKRICRKRIGIKDNSFVIAFIGWFNERKGAKRLADALTILSNDNIQAIFIGEGSEKPQYFNTIFEGKLSHEEIPIYLNAADAFVLPTLKEGCCNAIIEAMACGLPIISSDLSFNNDILTPWNSIRIDPTNVEEISEAIMTLHDDPDLRRKMSIAALSTAANLTIDKRAEKITRFIANNIVSQ